MLSEPNKLMNTKLGHSSKPSGNLVNSGLLTIETKRNCFSGEKSTEKQIG
jgi:hypothetical protein